MFVIVMRFYEIRVRYHCLFRQGLGPLCMVMEYEDQRCLGLFLIELTGHREKLSIDNTSTQAHQQRTTTAFFSMSLQVMLQVNQVLHKWDPKQDIAKGL